jgi:hypothetical protein
MSRPRPRPTRGSCGIKNVILIRERVLNSLYQWHLEGCPMHTESRTDIKHLLHWNNTAWRRAVLSAHVSKRKTNLKQRRKKETNRTVTSVLSENRSAGGVASSGWAVREMWGKAVPIQAWTGTEGSTRLRLPISWQSAHEGGEIFGLKHRPPLPLQEIFLVLVSVRGWVNPRVIVRPEGLCQIMPSTPSGIEPGTLRLVSQRLNQLQLP